MQPDTCVKHFPPNETNFQPEDEPVWLWLFVLELSKCGIESRSSHVKCYGVETIYFLRITTTHGIVINVWGFFREKMMLWSQNI